LHVRDLVNAFFTVLNCLDKKGVAQVFNVGSLDQVDVKRIAEIVREEMGIHNVHFSFKDMLGDGRGWKGDVKTMHLSVKKLMGTRLEAKVHERRSHKSKLQRTS